MLIDFKDNEEFLLLEAITKPFWTEIKKDENLIDFIRYLTVSEQTEPSMLAECIRFEGKYYVLYSPSVQYFGSTVAAGEGQYIHVQGAWFQMSTNRFLIEQNSIIIKDTMGLWVDVDFEK